MENAIVYKFSLTSHSLKLRCSDTFLKLWRFINDVFRVRYVSYINTCMILVKNIMFNLKDIFLSFIWFWVEMANKSVSVGITRTRSRFDGESPLWLGMGMGMGNTRNFQLGMGMGIYIYPPKYPSRLNY